MVKLTRKQREGINLIMETFDLIIVGGGPVGLFTGYFAGLHGLKTIILEALADYGGQPQMLYPAKTIQDIPAYRKINGTALTKQLLASLETTTTVLRKNYRATTFNKYKDLWVINHEIAAKSIIIATGQGAFRPKQLPIKLDDQIADHVHYSLPDPAIFTNKDVAVLGGGDSALDFSLELAKLARVTLIHRRPEFRGMESNVQKLKKLKNVEILTPYLPQALSFHDNKIRLTCKQVGSNKERQKDFDEILVAYGFRANNRFLRKWEVELEEGLVAVNSKMQTNLNGVYAIGDAVTYDGRAPLIGLGFGEGQIAVMQIMRQVFPEKMLTVHSTALQ
ncbi:MAG: NAD(P)/FAD-dependent oxidoreductase [Lactobacillus sp.]|jgi:thioredoxin reductase (NADPH)|nr:NAD(P)/FAD-dependent oxidoreductase [Lactobacillus sp.]MCI1883888.1 NAD(P)/FAD-dependent oxidoreductase [Lactobacillus sp.]